MWERDWTVYGDSRGERKIARSTLMVSQPPISPPHGEPGLKLNLLLWYPYCHEMNCLKSPEPVCCWRPVLSLELHRNVTMLVLGPVLHPLSGNPQVIKGSSPERSLQLEGSTSSDIANMDPELMVYWGQWNRLNGTKNWCDANGKYQGIIVRINGSW